MIVTDKETLSKVSEDVTDFTSTYKIAKLMYDELSKTKGVGIAAIQIGIAKRIIIINTKQVKLIVVNPTLSDGEKPNISKEGCLSVPFKKVRVKRFSKITINGFDVDGRPIQKRLKALSAFVAQHEVDHLNGITI